MNNWHDLIDDFLSESYSLLDNLEASLLELENDLQDENNINTVFRIAHTIKGGAGAMGFDDVTRLTHITEDVLDLVRQQKYFLSSKDITLLLAVKDELLLLLKTHEQQQECNPKVTNELIAELELIKQGVLGQNNPAPRLATDSQMLDIDFLPMAARFALDPSTLELFHNSLTIGERFVFIEIRFNQEYELKDVGPFEILNIITSFAEPVVMNPSIELLDTEYFPYLNVIIPSEQDLQYIQNKLSLADVVVSVTVTELSQKILEELYTFKGVNTEDNKEQEKIQKITPQPSPKAEEPNPSKEVVELPAYSEEKRNPTLKIESSRIDDLLNLLGELVIVRSGLSQFGDELENGIQHIRFLLRNYLSSSVDFPLHQNEDLNSQWNQQFRSEIENVSYGMEQYLDYSQQLSRISSSLHNEMMLLRMVPIQTVFSRFARLTRDIAKQLNKKIELVMEGTDTEIDKSFVEDLYDPLMHMIRNSLDHGIESPSDRFKKGKSETGTIMLSAQQEGDSIFIDIYDDGRGIDADKIAEKAIEKNFITSEQALTMTQEEKLALIFMPGLSTAKQVSSLSGRGVGMDVVNKKIKDLGGNVSIISKIDEGSTIRIQLPLTLAIIKGLIILVRQIHYIIPIASVEETIILDRSLIHQLQHYNALEFRNKLIPLIRLDEMLYNKHITVDYTNYMEYCIIVRYGNRQVGIIVPEVLQEQDIVVKPLDNDLIYSPGIAAATIVGNGEIGFILDISQVVRYYFKSKNKE